MTLRDDQQRATRDVDATFARGFRSPVLVAPTGWGKTFWAVDYMLRHIREGRRVWFVAHLREILDDTASRLQERSIPFGWIRSQHAADPDQLLQLVSIRTALARLDRLEPPDLIVVDEADLAIADGYQKVFEVLGQPQRLGLTGTPIRLDGRPMEAGGFDALIPTVDTLDLIDAGLLSRPRIWSFPPPTKIKRRGNDFDPDAAAALFGSRFLLGEALPHWQRHAIDERGTRPTVAFCSRNAQAELTAETWRQAGYRAMAVSGDSSDADRIEAQAGLRAGRLDLVACSDLWLAGVDIKELAALICLRPTDSVRVWLQMVGRLLRKGQAWPDVHLYDHAGNCRWPGIGDPTARRTWTLGGDGGLARMRETIRAMPSCPMCFSTYRVGHHCGDCGHDFRSIRLPDGRRVQPGELVEFDPNSSRAAAREEKAKAAALRQAQERACWDRTDVKASLARFIRLGVERGYHHPAGWAHHQVEQRLRWMRRPSRPSRASV